jgi:hypothetical protein
MVLVEEEIQMQMGINGRPGGHWEQVNPATMSVGAVPETEFGHPQELFSLLRCHPFDEEC